MIKNEVCLKCIYWLILAEMRGSTRSTMKRSLILFGFGLLCNTVTCLTEKCKSYASTPFHGRYCPTEGIITPNLPWHQCKVLCLQKSSCQAVNYDFTANLCTYFTATCPLAISHPDMAFVLFTGRQTDQCIEWIPKEDGNPTEDRSVRVNNDRFAARLQKDGSDYLGHLRVDLDDCFSRQDAGFKYSHGYPCQYLRMQNGCTVYFVNYVPGAPLPPNALIGGYTAEGLPLYIGRMKGFGGYYIPGSDGLVIYQGTFTEDVKLLVLL